MPSQINKKLLILDHKSLHKTNYFEYCLMIRLQTMYNQPTILFSLTFHYKNGNLTQGRNLAYNGKKPSICSILRHYGPASTCLCYFRCLNVILAFFPSFNFVCSQQIMTSSTLSKLNKYASMGSIIGFFWRTAKEGYHMTQRAFSSFYQFKKFIKFFTMAALLIQFFYGFPILLVLYYFNWTRHILHLILRYSGLSQTAVQMETYIAFIWSYVQVIGRNFTTSFHPSKFSSFGYADETRRGTFLRLQPKYMKNVYSCQLYDLVSKRFTLNPQGKLTNKSILQIQCDASGGISYIGEKLSPAVCMATTDDPHLLQTNVHAGYHGVRYVMCRPQDLHYTQQLDKRKFDIVICMNVLQDLDGLAEKIKVIMSVMEVGATLQVGEIVHQDKQHNFQYLVETAGFKIAQVMDITRNVLKALQKIKEQHTIKQQIIELFDGDKTRFINQLQDKHKYLVYTLSRA